VQAGKLVGGVGGDRLWFAPEWRYHWLGKPDWRGLGNYQVPADTDPGRYQFVDSEPGVVVLAAEGRLAERGGDQSLAFRVTRRIRTAQPPLPPDDPAMCDVRYVGIELDHELAIQNETRAGEIDLWQLVQIPVGSILIVPLRAEAGDRMQPLCYGLPGDWRTTSNRVTWHIQGDSNAKMGMAAAALTGRAGILRRLSPQHWCLMVRQFPVDASARYGDHPVGVVRDDQVLQAWDGLGFGELEIHSPMLDAARGPRSLRQTDQLWAFGAPAPAIAVLADRLLRVDIRELLAQHG
jgi:hypothetical protein